MNKIYLSGVVAEPPVRLGQEGAPEHVRFPLRVSHRTRQGVMKRELYPVHGWNGVAVWARANLRQGQRVMVQGYLTQRGMSLPEGGMVILSEVTAEELFTGMEAGEGAREAQGKEEDRQTGNEGLTENQGLNEGFTERKDQE